MTVVNGYTTTAEIRDHLGDVGAKLDEDLIDKAVNAASRRIDKFCGRRFWLDATAAQRRYRARDDQYLLIDDAFAVTSVAVGPGDGTFTTTLTVGTDYTLEPLDVDLSAGEPYAFWILSAQNALTWPLTGRGASILVSGKFGWSEVPDDINEAAILLATSLLRRKDAPFGVAGVSEFGAVRIARLDPDVRALIQPYVRMAAVDR